MFCFAMIILILGCGYLKTIHCYAQGVDNIVNNSFVLWVYDLVLWGNWG